MAIQSLKLGFHILPTNDQLMVRLRNKVLSSTSDDDISNKFRIVNRDLYSAEPWNVLKEDDPWEISNSLEKSAATRKIYVFALLNIVPGRKRAVRVAGKGTWSGSTGEKDVEGEGRPGSVIGRMSYFEYKIEQDPVVGHWTMHEYKLGGESYKGLESIPHAKKLVLCEITHVVDKDLGFHFSWTKTHFKILYEELKGLGYFLKKRQRHKQVDEEEVQKKRRKTEIPTSSTPITTEDFAKREEEKQTLSTEDREFATELDDMLGDQKDDDDIAKKQENQQVVLYHHHEGGLNDLQSCSSRSIPNLGESNFEFTQQLANSEEENYQKNNLNMLVEYNGTNQIMSPEDTHYYEDGGWSFDVDELLGKDWLSEFDPTQLQDQWVEVEGQGQLGGTDTTTNNGSSPSIINTQERCSHLDSDGAWKPIEGTEEILQIY